jgi:hypothetical protein
MRINGSWMSIRFYLLSFFFRYSHISGGMVFWASALIDFGSAQPDGLCRSQPNPIASEHQGSAHRRVTVLRLSSHPISV